MATQRPAIISERATKRRHKKQMIVSFGALLLSCVLFVGLIFLSRIDTFAIKTIEVQGASEMLKKEILLKAENFAEEYTYQFFPRRNVFLYPKDALHEHIVFAYPKIKEVSVKRIGLSRILIIVEERKPVALLCDHQRYVSESVGQCYFVDNGGYIFSQAPFFSDHVYFELYGAYAGATSTIATTTFAFDKDTVNVLGTQYLPQEIFEPIMLFMQTLDRAGIETYALTVLEDDLFEFDLTAGGVLRFSPKQDLLKALNDLAIAYEKKFFEEESALLKDVEYIDVRFTNKVLFKFKD